MRWVPALQKKLTTEDLRRMAAKTPVCLRLGSPSTSTPPAGRHGCDLSSSSFSPGTAHALCYQLLQATLQITHLAQISPVSAHLTVMLLMFYFTVTPNLRLYCTMFCHFFPLQNK